MQTAIATKAHSAPRPSSARAKRQREEYSGRKMFAAFRRDCVERNIEPNEDNLKLWDEQFNDSRIRKSFGTNEEIYHRGLRMLYRQFLDRYAVLFIRMSGQKGIRITDVRPDGRGGRRFVRNLDKLGIEFNLEKAKAELRNAVLRAKFFRLSAKEIYSLVDEALREIAS